LLEVEVQLIGDVQEGSDLDVALIGWRVEIEQEGHKKGKMPGEGVGLHVDVALADDEL